MKYFSETDKKITKKEIIEIAVIVFLVVLGLVTSIIKSVGSRDFHTADLSGDVTDYSLAWSNEYSRMIDMSKLFLQDKLPTTSEPMTLKKKLPKVEEGSMLYLHTRNLVVNVYLSDEESTTCIYKTGDNGGIEMLSGFDGYIFADIPESAGGKTIKLEIFTTEYAMGCCIDAVYLGSRGVIIRDIMKSSIIQLVSGVSDFVIGVVFVIFGYFTRKKLDSHKGSIFFGIFLMVISVRVCLNTTFAYMVIRDVYFIENCAKISLSIALPVLVAYIGTAYKVKNPKIMRIAALSDIVVMLLLFLCDITGLLPYTSSGIVLHAAIIASGIAAAVQFIVYLSKHREPEMRTKRFFYIAVLIFVFCSLYDIALYYQGFNGGDDLVMTRIGLLIMTLSAAVSVFTEILEMIRLGVEAGRIGSIAFTDANTGIGNVAAFKSRFEELDAKRMNYRYIAVVQFDVNNLKVINDTKGHEAGDLLIKSAANIIDETFGKAGGCYRTGGDEFIALIAGDYAPSAYEEAIYKFNKRIESFNKDPNRPFDLYIAYGVAYFQNDKAENVTLKDVHNIADQRMYNKKRELKAKYAKTAAEAIVR